MSIACIDDLGQLVKTETIDTNLFLLNILKNIYNIVENTKSLSDTDKLLEISHIFKTISFPRIESELKPTLFSQMFTDISAINNGGYGVIYKGKHYIDNKYYAIKRVPLYIDFIDKHEISKILLEHLREIRCLSSLDHPNIITYKTSWVEPDNNIYKSEYDNNLDLIYQNETSDECSKNITNVSKNFIKFNIFYQMDLMNMSLRDVLNNKQFKTKENLMFIFKSILKGLNYLHNLPSPIIHMDIKPENILLNIDIEQNNVLSVKIADFGLIKYHFEKNNLEGTRTYMAPECETQHLVTIKSDIYSLGIILYEIINNWDTEMERVVKIADLKKNPEKYLDLIWINKMISKNIDDRPNTEQLLDICANII